MTLKKQLLVVGALTLLIPLAGIQFVIQLEQALRAQELERLGDQAERIANLLAGEPLPEPAGRTLFAETFSRRLILDGYGDDWPNRPDRDGAPLLYPGGEHLNWRAALKEDQLWLFLHYHGLAPVFAQADPRQANDRLIVSWREPGGKLQERVIEARAPGRASVRDSGAAPEQTRPSPIKAVWQAQAGGFTIELQMPRPPPGSQFGFSLEHPQSQGGAVSLGEFGRTGSRDLPLLLEDQPQLNRTLAPFVTPGQSLTLISPDGWELARAADPQPAATEDIDQFGPLKLLQQVVLQGLRLLLAANQEPGELLRPDGAHWHGEPLRQASQSETGPGHYDAITRMGDSDPMLTVIAPIGAEDPHAWLISRRSTDALLSLSSTTLGRVLSRSLLLTFTLLLILVGYASWLSWRIARLRQAVDGVIDSEGRVSGELEPSAARDELGDLSRQFAGLVGQVRGYTQYLESFARKLSHELKTPLAVMRSSLDNLRHTDPTPEQTVYLDRASDGAARLSRIITAMSEATQLERSLSQTPRERFDLAPVVSAVADGYQALDARVRYQGPGTGCHMAGAPDLLIQALDKLVENARDFTPAQGLIQIRLEPDGNYHRLRVCNDGPPLPAGMAGHIFDSFVSLREPGASEGHLGQGLVIVKLVAEFHNARVIAENRPDAGGVCFSLMLPAVPATPDTRIPSG